MYACVNMCLRGCECVYVFLYVCTSFCFVCLFMQVHFACQGLRVLAQVGLGQHKRRGDVEIGSGQVVSNRTKSFMGSNQVESSQVKITSGKVGTVPFDGLKRKTKRS